ncbi:MAG: hypothetical protein ACXAD7_05345 [Candidatus Kariarchaeaceae archaeon]|jgi:hypothetical protein
MVDNLRPIKGGIFKKFRSGIFYEDIYKEHDINETDLISILNRNIKGNYDYKRILNGGHAAQKQFLKHLNNRWNPLEPDAPFESISPYIATKTSVTNDDE